MLKKGDVWHRVKNLWLVIWRKMMYNGCHGVKYRVMVDCMILDFIVKFVYNGLLALVIGAFSAVVGTFIPRRLIHYDRFPFREFRFEQGGRFYHMFGIEKWKLKLPDISEYIKSVFPKKVEPEAAKDRRYFARFAKETCVSELIHFALILTSPIYLVLNWDLDWGIVVMVLEIVANIPFIMVQRYNRPRLVRVAERGNRHSEVCGHGEPVEEKV